MASARTCRMCLSPQPRYGGHRALTSVILVATGALSRVGSDENPDALSRASGLGFLFFASTCQLPLRLISRRSVGLSSDTSLVDTFRRSALAERLGILAADCGPVSLRIRLFAERFIRWWSWSAECVARGAKEGMLRKVAPLLPRLAGRAAVKPSRCCLPSGGECRMRPPVAVRSPELPVPVGDCRCPLTPADSVFKDHYGSPPNDRPRH